MTAPPIAAWDMALAGIAQLERKIDGLAESQRQLQGQITDVRAAYTRSAPMSSFLELEVRVGELEKGATAAILQRLGDDAIERQLRQRATDRRERRSFIALAALAIAVVALVAALLWFGARGYL